MKKKEEKKPICELSYFSEHGVILKECPLLQISN